MNSAIFRPEESVNFIKMKLRLNLMWFRGVTVSTLDSESSNPSSNLVGTLLF